MISLHEPRFTIEDEAAVLETLRSTWVSTGGPFVEQFEAKFAQYTGCSHAVSVSNGTLALHLALEVLKRQRRITQNFDVLVPTLSFIATSNAVSHANGTPVLVDCAPNSVNISPEMVRAIVRDKYKRDSSGSLINSISGNKLLCIMPAHIMGWSCDMQGIYKISVEYNIPIIDDAAEALGSRYQDGRHLGKGSLAAVFSFNGNKILTTGGGGMLVTDDQDFANLAKHLSTTAKTDGLRYVHDQVGYNYRMVNILAALGVSQLARITETLERKRVISDAYMERFAGSGVAILKEPNCISNNWIINAIFETKTQREKALKTLLDRKIQARPLWTPAHRLSFMSDQNSLQQQFPNAENMWSRVLSLPSSAHLTVDEISKVANSVKETL